MRYHILILGTFYILIHILILRADCQTSKFTLPEKIDNKDEAHIKSNIKPRSASRTEKGAPTRFIYNPKDKRDPFVPYITKDGKVLSMPGVLGEVVVEGIVYDPQGTSVCVINGNVLKEGETCENFKILKIKVDTVIVSCQNKEYEIELRKETSNEKQKEDSIQDSLDTDNF
ncbi:MAG: hypothetical protein FJZ16_01575 [Candidatus Omnitrophica bacterium]|nr:hypothetical protein [Candidatus Omnitrophota bacterium]